MFMRGDNNGVASLIHIHNRFTVNHISDHPGDNWVVLRKLGFYLFNGHALNRPGGKPILTQKLRDWRRVHAIGVGRNLPPAVGCDIAHKAELRIVGEGEVELKRRFIDRNAKKASPINSRACLAAQFVGLLMPADIADHCGGGENMLFNGWAWRGSWLSGWSWGGCGGGRAGWRRAWSRGWRNWSCVGFGDLGRLASRRKQ